MGIGSHARRRCRLVSFLPLHDKSLAMNYIEQNALRESRLEAIRAEAKEKGRVAVPGIRPVDSPLPLASPETGYYKQPLLKEPQWSPLIPVYFFVGGATGSLGVIGSLADVLGGNRKLAQKARWMATSGAVLSTALLIADLGRPSRFLNMLRVFKPQSTMSMGSWALSGFAVSASIASFADLLALRFGKRLPLRVMRGIGRVGAVLFGMPLHNYTGVLIGASVIPVWNNRIRSLPREFGMSGVQSAVGLLELAGEAGDPALNYLGLLSAGFESWEGIDLLRTSLQAVAPAKKGISGALVQSAGVLSGPLPLALRIASLFLKNRKRLRRLAAWSGIIGSLFMRHGWLYAGHVSSRDWKTPLQIAGPSSDPIS
jgi:formate-dependent nitrite reductase membrane component NrfD